MGDAQWRSLRPFHIDHRELDGCTPQECFVLGYELAVIDTALKQPAAIALPVHAANRHRIEDGCRRARRTYTLNWMAEDSSETWLWLAVPAVDAAAAP